MGFNQGKQANPACSCGPPVWFQRLSFSAERTAHTVVGTAAQRLPPCGQQPAGQISCLGYTGADSTSKADRLQGEPPPSTIGYSQYSCVDKAHSLLQQKKVPCSQSRCSQQAATLAHVQPAACPSLHNDIADRHHTSLPQCATAADRAAQMQPAACVQTDTYPMHRYTSAPSSQQHNPHRED